MHILGTWVGLKFQNQVKHYILAQFQSVSCVAVSDPPCIPPQGRSRAYIRRSQAVAACLRPTWPKYFPIPYFI